MKVSAYDAASSRFFVFEKPNCCSDCLGSINLKCLYQWSLTMYYGYCWDYSQAVLLSSDSLRYAWCVSRSEWSPLPTSRCLFRTFLLCQSTAELSSAWLQVTGWPLLHSSFGWLYRTYDEPSSSVFLLKTCLKIDLSGCSSNCWCYRIGSVAGLVKRVTGHRARTTAWFDSTSWSLPNQLRSVCWLTSPPLSFSLRLRYRATIHHRT